MRRFLSASVAALVLALMAPFSAAADTPLENHLISRAGFASFTWAEGCSAVSVYLSSDTALYFPAHGDGGGVARQGLTSLAIIVEDTCAEPAGVPPAAGGGGGGPLVADWLGQTQDALIVHGNLNTAELHATIPMEDQLTGAWDVATVDMAWTAVGPDVVEPSRIHLRYPHEVVLSSNSNDTARDAVAAGSVSMDGTNWTPDPAEALLTATRFHCRQVGFAQIGSDWGLCY